MYVFMFFIFVFNFSCQVVLSGSSCPMLLHFLDLLIFMLRQDFIDLVLFCISFFLWNFQFVFVGLGGSCFLLVFVWDASGRVDGDRGAGYGFPL